MARCARLVAELADHVGGHADVAERSIMLAIRPDPARGDRATAGFTGVMDDEPPARALTGGIKAIAPGGVLGDPRGMSSHLGLSHLSAVAGLLAAFATARYRPLA
ncbi:creatininase family protein [Kitasatospora sp. NPDC057940]|uniref:creatininase family protein n=1 Tax=Kitasatospora sp. NPDC057940 TaxID=3346285 RepID=UPI0036DCE3C5